MPILGRSAALPCSSSDAMPLPHNSFKSALNEGRQQLGIWSTFCSPIVAEILGKSGFDWILFDSEHSPVEIAGLLPLLQAASGGPAACVVRPAWNDPVLIKRILDIGAQTVLLPFVQNSEEAHRAVQSCRYPPVGRRGVSGTTRASDFGRTGNYLTAAAEQTCVLVQVETGEALGQLAQIAGVPGVDGVFIGPSDLSASMGYLGNPGHADVQAAIKAAVGPIRAAGKAAGILATSVPDAKRYLAWGYQFVACNVDVRIFVQGLDALRTEMTSQ
jgi:4-hydroxy-2-oxoheptanedioate aldolase